ncbi:MAG: exodeoxyribonuclease VII small subunit [Candidatus Omnitrophica bacterium]|nr:exodeoxyribonuclease VII small subunit [Candidatus Omnitrophota bacterium]
MEKVNFEKALEKLEKVVSDLEKGDVSLEDSLRFYEQGVNLADFCQKEIEKAKKKVEILVKHDDGSVSLEPFDENEHKDDVVTSRKIKPKKKEGPSLFE